VYLTAGATYEIRQLGGGNLYDPYLQGIYNASGVIIANTSNDDSGGTRDSLVTFTPTTSDYYYVAASAYSSYTGAYSVTVTAATTAPIADITPSTATTATLPSGARSSTIGTAGDVDWFRVNLVAGITYTFEQSSSSSTVDSYLRGIYNASGVLIANTSNDDLSSSSNDARVTFTPTANGTYYVAAGAYGSTTGAYTLTMSAQDVPAAIGTKGSLPTTGVAISGLIDSAYDHDWYAVQLTTGVTYRVAMNATTGLNGLDAPYIYGIRDAAGTLLPSTSLDDIVYGVNLNAEIYFTLDQTGTYYPVFPRCVDDAVT